MAPNQSNLSSDKYGYDFVVSSTQAAINTGLLEYLQNTKAVQPIHYLVFLADENGDPTTEMTLDKFLEIPGAVNPFDVPNGTVWKQDQRCQTLTDISFVCAIRMQAGVPPGLMKMVPGVGPQLQLPKPIVTLGTTSDNVLFNMYCSDVTMIKNSPPSGFGNKGAWTWFSQPPGTPWYVQTRTNLQVSALDKDLDTPYFNSRPEEKAMLRAKLENLSGSAFSLQQLLFNLDSAIAQTVPSFQGVLDKGAEYLLGKSFIQLWTAIAKERGLPLVGISAVAQTKDDSPLRLTGLERWVSPVVDGLTGVKINNPSDAEIDATTLNYLCAANGHKLPGSSSFNWNWVEPRDIDQSSGVIAVNRDTMAQYLLSI